MHHAAHERAFEHLVEKYRNPQAAQANQVKFNEERIAKVRAALGLRPQFLPLQINLPAAAQNFPVTATTDELKYDVIITGAITDGEDKQITLERDTESGTQFVSVGTAAGARLSLDAIAGKSMESSGVNGIQPLEPFLLKAGEGLRVGVYKPLVTSDAEIVSIVFVGYRVLSTAAVADMFTKTIEEQILFAVNQRVSPEPRFAVCPVVFDAGGNAIAETPKTSEPRFIYGFRSTVKNAMVTLGFDKDNAFSRGFFPIWALATEAGVNSENYRMLKSPIFVEPQQQLYFSLKNTINGVAFAENGNLEVLEGGV